MATGLHEAIGKDVLLTADGVKDLTKAQAEQFVAALNGKTAWVYPVKKLAVAVPTAEEKIKADLDAMEDAFKS